MAERIIFDELMQSMQELRGHHEGQTTLKLHKVDSPPPATINPDELRSIREKLNLSQADFADYLRTWDTTYRNWKRGRARLKAKAVLLIRIVQQDPGMLKTLARL